LLILQWQDLSNAHLDMYIWRPLISALQQLNVLLRHWVLASFMWKLQLMDFTTPTTTYHLLFWEHLQLSTTPGVVVGFPDHLLQ